MSKLLEDLIQQKRNDTESYQQFLKQAEALAKKLHTGQAEKQAPAALWGNKEAIVLYNNLPTVLAASVASNASCEPTLQYDGNRVQLALILDKAIREHAPANWKGDPIRESQVKNAIHDVLGKNRAATEKLFALIKNQAGY